MTTRATADEAGCWLEGSRGWRISGQVVRKAQEWGMPLSDDDDIVLRAFLDDYADDPSEAIWEMADEATQWLNDNVAPEGYSFGFYDGEFFLWSESSWEDA